MSFNSFVFVYFFALVWGLYLVLGHRPRNLLLLAASLAFYGWWDARFLILLIGHGLVDWACALKIHGASTAAAKRRWLLLSLATGLGVLGFFKYFGFFTESLAAALASVGVTLSKPALEVLLPVGISFYTFQTIGYVVDVYRGKVAPERAPLDFLLFVCFFPQLVAGPIERARALLPQIKTPRRVTETHLREGGYLLLLGYFKKVVVADNLAPYVDKVSNDVGALSGSQLAVAFYAMVFFIYADFSGYSDIARGLGKLLGFDLSVNFRMPFFAKNPPDFWRRWHVTLSEWFRDYVYTPLLRLPGKAGRSPAWVGTAALVTLALCGLWHGASWNFVAFGAAHGLLLVAYYAVRPALRRLRLPRGLATFASFHILSALVVLFFLREPDDWRVFFRQLVLGTYNADALPALYTLLLFGGPLFLLEWAQERSGNLLVLRRLPRAGRYACYAALWAAIVLAGETGTHAFVYFQF